MWEPSLDAYRLEQEWGLGHIGDTVRYRLGLYGPLEAHIEVIQDDEEEFVYATPSGIVGHRIESFKFWRNCQ